MIRVLVTGGRDLADRELVYAALDWVRTVFGSGWTLMHGAAKGADQLAHEWATSRGWAVERHPAEWALHGRAAGVLRNDRMVRLRPILCVAFPGGSGTADCRERVERAGIPLFEAVRVDGRPVVRRVDGE